MQFAVYLSQAYGYFDSSTANATIPGVMLQVSLFNQYFDSQLAAAPPIPVQKTVGHLLRRLARLAGYRSYNPEYAPLR